MFHEGFHCFYFERLFSISNQKHRDPISVKTLELNGYLITLKNLQNLEIHSKRETLSDRALDYIFLMAPNLREFSIRCGWTGSYTITDAGIRKLSKKIPLIEKMDLNFPIVSQNGGGFISGFPNLQELKIQQLIEFAVVKKTFLVNLKLVCPNLKFLRHVDDKTVFV